MKQNFEKVKAALVEAVFRTMENMAFEQVELIDDNQDVNKNDVIQELAPEVLALLEAEEEGDDADSAEKQSGEDDPNANTKLWTTIPLMKPYRGQLALIFSSRYANQLTEAIYGEMDDIDLSAITVLDAVAEIINTIAGRFIDKLIPANREFELGLPNTGEGDPPNMDDEFLTLNFDLGDDVMKAILAGRELEQWENIESNKKETVS